MKLTNNRGIAMVLSIVMAFVLVTIGTVFALKVATEKRATLREVYQTQAYYMADGGVNRAIQYVNLMINDQLMAAISSKSTNAWVAEVAGYLAVAEPSGLPLLLNNLAGLTQVDETLEYQSGTIVLETDPDSGDAIRSLSYKIYFSDKAEPAEVADQVWNFYYDCLVEAVGNYNGIVTKTVKARGDFTVEIRKGSFARYALFTNHHTSSSGSNVWFTDNTNFSGPLHTNERFNFAFNPGSVFDGVVTQAYSSARFYNNGWTVLLNADSNGTRDVPTFNAGFTRGVDPISMATTSDMAEMKEQAATAATYVSNGIYVPESSGSLTGGVYVRGNVDSISLAVNGSNQAEYTIVQGGTTKVITVDDSNNQTQVYDGSTTTVYSGLPHGVDGLGTLIYVEGRVDNLSGTVQEDTNITIASENDLIIQGHLRYSDYVAPSGNPGDAGYTPPNAMTSDNILGLVSWEGDIRVGTSAPDNLDVHATVLAPDGVFTVDNYNSSYIGPRGDVTLLGGVITDYYGPFGTFSSATGNNISGYGRNFVYDERMLKDSPSYFPTVNQFIAFTNDLTDRIVWQEGS